MMGIPLPTTELHEHSPGICDFFTCDELAEYVTPVELEEIDPRPLDLCRRHVIVLNGWQREAQQARTDRSSK